MSSHVPQSQCSLLLWDWARLPSGIPTTPVSSFLVSAGCFLRAPSVSGYVQKLRQRARLSAGTQTQFEPDGKWLHQFVFAPRRGWMFHGDKG